MPQKPGSQTRPREKAPAAICRKVIAAKLVGLGDRQLAAGHSGVDSAP
jgi:hypothetical protein